MKKTFITLVNTALSNLELIGEADKKASICAELAKAVAMSGLMNEVIEKEEVEEEPVRETKKKTSRKSKALKKDALKPEASKVDEEVEPVEKIEEPVEEETEAVEPVEPIEESEENDFTQEQLDTLAIYVDAWGDEYVYDTCLSAFSEGLLSGIDNITPSNIEGFLVYLEDVAKMLADENEQ